LLVKKPQIDEGCSSPLRTKRPPKENIQFLHVLPWINVTLL